MKISEIAKKCNVSIGTVDRVLHKRGRVALETRKKIEKVIEESGYKPNPIAQNLKTGKQLKIGVLIPQLGSEYGYWKILYKGMEKAEKEYAFFGVVLIKKEFNRSVAGDLTLKAQELLSENIDVLCLAPIVKEESEKVLTLIKKIPYAFFDSSLPSYSPISENLQNAYQAGLTAGRLMSLLAPEAHKLACISVYCHANNLDQRTNGFTEYYAHHQPAVEIISVKNEFSCTNKDYDTWFTSFLQERGPFDGIFITNDAVGKFSKTLEHIPLQKKPKIIGFDSIGENITQLKKSTIDALISQQPERQGYLTISEVFRFMVMHQEKGTEQVHIPIDIILKENLG